VDGTEELGRRVAKPLRKALASLQLQRADPHPNQPDRQKVVPHQLRQSLLAVRSKLLDSRQKQEPNLLQEHRQKEKGKGRKQRQLQAGTKQRA
jgi:hypothetical protein